MAVDNNKKELKDLWLFDDGSKNSNWFSSKLKQIKKFFDKWSIISFYRTLIKSSSLILASIFPSSLGYSNWGSPTNLYPTHSMSNLHTSSHAMTPHLGSYSHHYAWQSHTPSNHQVDNFELYKKLSPYE